jgi:Tfp pilus assembly protein PilZ
MKPAAEALKKYNVVIPKLFQIILNISEDKQLLLLKYAEEATYDRVYTNTIKNISQKGVFIETQRPLFVGEELLLSFSIAGIEKPLKINGEIVQVNRSGIGVEFKNMSPYVEEMLGTLISRMKEELD